MLALAKKSETLYLREEALGPSLLSVLQVTVQELTQDVSRNV